MNRQEVITDLTRLGFKITDLPTPKFHQFIDPEGKYEHPLDIRLIKFLESGKLTGLEALALSKKYFSTSENPIYYHGTPKSRAELIGGQLKPHQATWSDVYGNLYADGEPAIATSTTWRIPIIRSLFHNDSPVLNGEEYMILNVMQDSSNKRFLFTSSDALTTLTDTNTTGYVHVVKEPFDRQDVHKIDRNGIDMREYRITKDVYPFLVIPTTVKDLPDDLIVIDGSKEKVMPLLYTLPHSDIPTLLTRFNAEGIDMKPVNGHWPLNYHPKSRIK